MSPAASTVAAAADRRFDVICLGRLGVHFCAQELGAPLEDATSFARDLGGSSGSIAFGCARLGLRAAMASRVGDDHMGRFLTEKLAAEGCDVSHVSTDRDRPTGLAVLGAALGDRDGFPRLASREDCADTAVEDGDVEEAFVAKSRSLVVTGTHFSTEHTRRVGSLALERARRHGVKTVLDVDHRSLLRGPAEPAAGAGRLAAGDRVTAHLLALLPRFDLVVGTVEEFRIAGAQEDLLGSLRAVRALTPATLVVKLGAGGCAVVEGSVPARLEDALLVPGWPVKVMNGLGAGDAFMAGLLSGWLTGQGWERSGRLANACGALVVSRQARSASMPTPEELAWFMTHPGPERPDLDRHLARLHRVTPRRRRRDELHLLAFDDRVQLFELAREVGAPEARLRDLKALLVRALAEAEPTLDLAGRVGALVDDTYGDDALLAACGRGWWLGRPVEVPGSAPLVFEGGRSVGSRLLSWPREHVVKCRVRFHPDEPVEERLEQETQLLALHDAVEASGNELMLEVTPPAYLPSDGQTVARALKRLYNIGIFPEWWRLAPMPAASWREVDALLAERDPWCRGVLVLGQDASLDDLDGAFREAAEAKSCLGFAAGRVIWEGPSRGWLAGQLDDARLVELVRCDFQALVELWRLARLGRRPS